MTAGGALLSQIRSQVVESIRPGITAQKLDQLAERLIIRSGGKPSFKRVPGYKYATCINLNQGVVHGIPGSQKIKNGDFASVDIGFYYRGYHTDAATTVLVGKGSKQHQSFLETGKIALKKAISKAKPGNRVEDISRAIQRTIKDAGYSCSKSLTGHGIGRNLHEEPPIPCIVPEISENSPLLKAGQTLAVEVIYAMGREELELKSDGWTLVTKDGKRAALFEETVLIKKNKPLILTSNKNRYNTR